MLEFVVDASVALKIYKKEENSEVARQLFGKAKKEFRLYAPEIIVYEIANKLRVLYAEDEAYKRIKSFVRDYLKSLTPVFRKGWEFGMNEFGFPGLVITTPPGYDEKNLLEALKIAKDNETSFYDATYIMLARIFKTKLVTADNELLTKFPDNTISLIELKELYLQ